MKTQELSVADWLLANCCEWFNGARITDLSDFNIDYSQNTIDGRYILVKTRDEYLPYTFRSFSSFTIFGNNLKSFKNFPTRYIGATKPLIRIHECDNLDFLYFPTDIENLCLRLSGMDDITISDVFKNKDLRLSTISFAKCNNKNIIDLSTWDDINVVNATISPTTRLKNLSHVLDIPHTKMVTFMIDNSNDSFYTEAPIKRLNPIIHEFRNRKNNASEYKMDFVLTLIANDFEDEI